MRTRSITSLRRTFSRWSTLRTEAGGGAAKSPTGAPGPPAGGATTGRQDTGQYVIPSALDKRYLVWSGQFKKASEIPDRLNSMTVTKAREWGRIRVSLGMIAVTVLACVWMVYEGKAAVKRGENLNDMNLEWHRKYNEEYAQKNPAPAK